MTYASLRIVDKYNYYYYNFKF